MTTNTPLRSAIVPVFLIACLLLGGSTRSAWPNLAIQISAIAILASAALAAPRAKSGQPGQNLVRLCYSMVALILLQLIPLPPRLWSALPSRDSVAEGYALLGQPLPWLPLSLTPYDTMTSALWLLPPLAVIAAVLRLGAYRELWLAIALGVAAFGGVFLGVLQVTSADSVSSPWYIYSITNYGQATGFFANSNHMATLLLVTIPFMVALLGGKRGRRRQLQQDAGRFAIVGGAILVLVLGVALNKSTAGVALSIPVVAASVLMRTSLSVRWAGWGIGAVVVLGVAALIAVFVTPLQSGSASAGDDLSFSTRATSIGNSLRAAADVFPMGSGSGSFNSVYPAYENPDIVDRTYINHVHNDYIEIALETGLPGLILMMAVLLWWLGRTIAIWRAPIIDYFARASTIASGAILCHSMVDYPLRTSAIAAVFATCLALMAGPRRRLKIESGAAAGEERARHLSIA